MSETGHSPVLPLTETAAAVPVGGSRSRRRRLPSPEEQKRRKEWGATWGKMTGDAIRRAMEGVR